MIREFAEPPVAAEPGCSRGEPSGSFGGAAEEDSPAGAGGVSLWEAGCHAAVSSFSGGPPAVPDNSAAIVTLSGLDYEFPAGKFLLPGPAAYRNRCFPLLWYKHVLMLRWSKHQDSSVSV
jgi:hypothetical protein